MLPAILKSTLKMKPKIIIIGGGGQAKVAIDALQRLRSHQIYGIIDPALNAGAAVLGIRVLGGDDLLGKIFNQGVGEAFIGIGSTGDCMLRKKMDRILKEIGYHLPVVVHPQAVLGAEVTLGEGTFVAAGAVVQSGTRIGRNVIVNTCASLDHDCVIGDYAHIAPRAVLCGGVSVGEEAHIGAGAIVIQYLTIGKGTFVKAGAVITRDVPEKVKDDGYRREKKGLYYC